MELTLEQYEQIQKYADGDMTPEEQEAFLMRVSSDPELEDCLYLELAVRENAAEIQSRPDINDVAEKKGSQFDDPAYIKLLIENAGEEWQKKRTVQNLENKVNTPQSVVRPMKRTAAGFRLWPSIAAAAVIIIAVSIIFFRVFKNSSTQIANKPKDSSLLKNDSLNNRRIIDSSKIQRQEDMQIDYARLYEESYRKDDAPAEAPQLLASAFSDYENGDYKKLQRFDLDHIPTSRGETNYQNSPQYIREVGHYYKAISFIETKKEEKAVVSLNWVINNAKNEKLHVKAQWYLALLQIKKGNKSEAVSLLKAVAANKKLKSYNSKALRLLQSLQ